MTENSELQDALEQQTERFRETTQAIAQKLPRAYRGYVEELEESLIGAFTVLCEKVVWQQDMLDRVQFHLESYNDA